MAKKRKKGRPKIPINWEEFDKLCGLQCTLLEIAEWFGCTDDTIENRVKEVHGMLFSEYFTIKAAKGKIALRRAQFQLATKFPAMAIFLGKNYLGQSDKYEHETKGTLDINYNGATSKEELSRRLGDRLSKLGVFQPANRN